MKSSVISVMSFERLGFSKGRNKLAYGTAVSRRAEAIGSLSTRTGDDGNASETIKLIAADNRSTWICEYARELT